MLTLTIDSGLEQDVRELAMRSAVNVEDVCRVLLADRIRHSALPPTRYEPPSLSPEEFQKVVNSFGKNAAPDAYIPADANIRDLAYPDGDDE